MGDFVFFSFFICLKIDFTKDEVEIQTKDKLSYNYIPITWGEVGIYFRGASNCVIALAAESREAKPITELILGGWNNTKSVVRSNRNDKAEVATVNLVSRDYFSYFRILWRKNGVTVKKGEQVILTAPDVVKFHPNFVGVRTGWGATGQWRIFIGGEARRGEDRDSR